MTNKSNSVEKVGGIIAVNYSSGKLELVDRLNRPVYIGRDNYGNIRLWYVTELKKDGTPDARSRGRRIYDTFQEKYGTPGLVAHRQEREDAAAPIRVEIAKLETELAVKEAELLALYR